MSEQKKGLIDALDTLLRRVDDIDDTLDGSFALAKAEGKALSAGPADAIPVEDLQNIALDRVLLVSERLIGVRSRLEGVVGKF